MMNKQMYDDLRKSLSRATVCLCGQVLTEEEAKPLREFQEEIQMKLTTTYEWYEKANKEHKQKGGDILE